MNNNTINAANSIQGVDQVLDLWAEELPEQLNHGGAPLGTLSTGTSTFSTFSTITCS